MTVHTVHVQNSLFCSTACRKQRALIKGSACSDCQLQSCWLSLKPACPQCSHQDSDREQLCARCRHMGKIPGDRAQASSMRHRAMQARSCTVERRRAKPRGSKLRYAQLMLALECQSSASEACAAWYFKSEKDLKLELHLRWMHWLQHVLFPHIVVFE